MDWYFHHLACDAIWSIGDKDEILDDLALVKQPTGPVLSQRRDNTSHVPSEIAKSTYAT